MVRNVKSQQPAAPAHRHAGISGEQIFKEKGHAPKRAVGNVFARRLPSLVEHRRDHGVQPRVHALDALDGRLDQFEGLDFLLAHQLRLRRGV